MVTEMNQSWTKANWDLEKKTHTHKLKLLNQTVWFFQNTRAKELFSNPDVDGGLIGGASLKGDDFISIIDAF